MFEKIKIKVQKFLEKIGQENQKTYGDKKMDCCDLNKPKKEKKEEK